MRKKNCRYSFFSTISEVGFSVFVLHELKLSFFLLVLFSLCLSQFSVFVVFAAQNTSASQFEACLDVLNFLLNVAFMQVKNEPTQTSRLEKGFLENRVVRTLVSSPQNSNCCHCLHVLV